MDYDTAMAKLANNINRIYSQTGKLTLDDMIKLTSKSK